MEAVAWWEVVSRPLSHLPLVQLQVGAALSVRGRGKAQAVQGSKKHPLVM